MIIYDEKIPQYPYVLYKSFQAAEEKRLYLSPKEGRIFKVTIELDGD